MCAREADGDPALGDTGTHGGARRYGRSVRAEVQRRPRHGRPVARQNLLQDPDTFIRAEVFIKTKAPERRMVYRRVIPSGNVVTLEASIVDASRPGWELSWCGIYTFDDQGRIISDHSYLNRNDWPGISELLGKVHP